MLAHLVRLGRKCRRMNSVHDVDFRDIALEKALEKALDGVDEIPEHDLSFLAVGETTFWLISLMQCVSAYFLCGRLD